MSDILRSSVPRHAVFTIPLIKGKEKGDTVVEGRTKKPKLFLEVYWTPSEAFHHSFRNLLLEHDDELMGVKVRISRLSWTCMQSLFIYVQHVL